MQSNRKPWFRVVATVLVVTMLAAGASSASARQELPGIAPAAFSGASLLPTGSGVTHLTVEELHAVDGETIQFLVIGAKAAARVVASCIRSAPCREGAKKVGRAVVNAADKALKAAGAYYTARELARDVERLLDRD